MAITEEERHRMYQRLEEVLGREEAATLMEHLPPVGWADVATKRDVDHATQVLRGELEHGLGLLRGDLEHGLGSMRVDLEHELGSLRGDLEHGLGSVRSEIGVLRSDLAGFGHQLRAEWRREMLLQTFALISANGVITGLAVAAVRLV